MGGRVGGGAGVNHQLSLWHFLSTPPLQRQKWQWGALPQNPCLRNFLVLVKSTNGGGSLWTKTYDGPGQPCKAGWEPPALGRWYCQAPTGWLHPRTSRAPAGSQSQPLLSPHYFTTLVKSRRPSPLLLRGRVQPSPQPSQAPAHEQHIRQKCKKREDILPSLSARKYGRQRFKPLTLGLVCAHSCMPAMKIRFLEICNSIIYLIFVLFPRYKHTSNIEANFSCININYFDCIYQNQSQFI